MPAHLEQIWECGMPLCDDIVTHLEVGNPWELVSEICEDIENEKEVSKFYCK